MPVHKRIRLSGYRWLQWLVFVLWFLLTGFFGNHGIAFADAGVQVESDERYRWHLRSGVQIAHHCPDFRYDPVTSSQVSAWNDNRNDALTKLSSVSLQRDINDKTTVGLFYSSDGSWGKIYGKQSFFTLRRDLEIDLKSLKLQYSRVIWKPGRFSSGASVSVQGLLLSMKANLPFYGYQQEEYLVAVPTVGIFAEYRSKGALKYRGTCEYMTLPLGDIDGRLVEVTVGAEYRLNNRFFLGAGYRFSDRDVRVNERKYTVKGSCEVHGYQMYTGFDF